ncbi:MAG: hypothetical protein LR001_01520 [Clostridiales bacterium]|nr:hypothetical protein [Clostridiales bacterium]
MTATEILTSPEALKKATVGSIMGAAGGVHMAAPGAVLDTVVNLRDNVAGAAIDAIAKRGAKRLTPKEAMANVDTIAQDLKKAKAADTITDDLRFGEFDATKTYPEEDIHTLIEEMVARPKDFPNEPGKTQFFQNNKEVIGKTIQNIKGKESERQTKIDAIKPSQTTAEDKMTDERDLQDIEDDEIKASQNKMADSITKAKEGGKTQEELVESVNNSKMNETEKEAVLKIVEGVFTPAEEKNVRKAVEKFKKLNLGAGIVFEALEWQTDKQKALDSVLDTRVATRPTPNRKRKRLVSMADNDFFNLVIEGDMSAMGSQAVDSKITRDVLHKLDRNIPKNRKRHEDLKEFNDKYLNHLLKKDTGIEIIETAAPEDRAAVALRLAVVAVNQVHSSTVSSLHEALNADAVRMPGATAKYKVAAQIGKDFTHSYGLTLQGGNKDNPAAYTKLGLQGLKLLEALGLINTEKTRGEIYNTNNVVDEDNKLVGPKRLGLTTDADIETGEEVTTGPVVALVGGLDNREADLFRTLKPLLNIGNVEIPHSHPLDADEEIITDKPGLSEVQEEALRDLINKPMQIKRSMLKMFDEWKRDYDIAISNGETLVSFINKNKTLKGFLGIQIVPKHSFLKESVEGSNWAKMQNFRDLIDNWDELGNIDDKYFEYKVDVNERISLVNNVLNFQHDKVMSRNLVTSSVMNTTTTKEELDFLVSEIMDESGLSGEAILNSGVDPVLDNLVEQFNDNDYSGRRQIIKSMQTKRHPFYGVGSGFKVYSLLEGISDIRDRDGYKVSTQYNPGADASASGVMNILINVIGLSKDDAEIDFLKEMLTKFGVYFGGVKPKGERSDPYKETIKATQANDKNAAKVLAQLKNLGISLRNLAKPTVMTWFYGASDPRVAEATGELVALEVYKKAVNGDVEAEAIIRSIPGLEKTLLMKMTAKEFAILSEHFRDELGDSMIIELKKLFPQVVEYRSIMKDRQGRNVFDMLKVLFGDKWKGTFPGAVTPILGGESTDPGANISVKKDKNVLMKEAEILVDEDDETIEMPPLLAYLPMDNPTSIAVSPQHSQDSAQNMSSSTVMTNGHQTIHDAKYGTVKDILKARVDQNRTYISLATDYDYLEQALSIFKTFGPNNVEEGKKETYERFVAYLESIIAKSQEIKANLIGSDSYAEVFGLREDQLFDVDSAPIVKNPPKKSPEPTGLSHPSEFGGLMGKIDGRTTLNSLKNILVEYAEVFNIDQEHIDMLNNAYAQYGKGELPKLKISDKFNWSSDTKGNRVIEIDPYNKSADTAENATRFIELVLHGLEYDLTANYIASEKGTKSPEVKYMRAVVKRLKRNFNPKTANPDLREKIEYILSGDDTRTIQELTAVLRAEPKYAEEISKIIHHRTVKSFVSTLLQAVEKVILKAFKFNSDKDISMENTIAALELLRKNGKNVTGSGSSPKKTVQEKKPTTKKTVQEEKAVTKPAIQEEKVTVNKTITEKKPTTKKTVQKEKPTTKKTVEEEDERLPGFLRTKSLEEFAKERFKALTKEFTGKTTFNSLRDMLIHDRTLVISQDHLDMLKDAYAQYDKGELPKLKIGNKFNWSSDAKGNRIIEIDPYNKSATTAENTTRFVELLLHEMEHDLTASYITSKEGAKSPEVKYMRSVVKRLKKEFNPETADPDVKARIEYILSGDETRAVQELTAVLRAEPTYAEGISKIIHGKTVKSFVSTLLQATKRAIIRAFKHDKNKEITIENTVAVLELLREHGKNIIAEGDNAAGPVKAELIKESSPDKKNKQDEEDISIKADNSLIGVIDTATAGMLGVVVAAAGKVVLPLAKEGHRYLMNNTELYKGAANLIKHGVWDSVLVRQLKNTLGVDDTLDDKTLRELLGVGTDMEQKSYSIITENIPKLTAGIAKVFKTDAEKAKLRKIYAKTSIAHVLANAALEKRLLGNETIEEIVADYKLSPKMEGYAKELSKFYVTGITGKGNMTNSGKVPTESAEAQVEFDEYVALLSLQSIEGSLDMIRDMHAKDSELYDTIKSATLTVRATSDLVNGVSGNLTNIDYTDYHGNYILDITEKPYEYKLVAPGTTNALKYNKDDAWKQIENNGKEGYDLFVREKELGFISKGVGISTNRFTNGYPLKTKWVEEQIALDSAFITKNNISKTFVNNNERYILNIKEAVKEKELSMVNDLADSLYNTIVHNKELQEMKTITDIIKRKAITTVGSKNIDSLVKDIRRARLGKDTTRPIPMFLKINYEELGHDFKLPNELVYYYKVPDTSKVSTYDGFNEHLDLIRKDAEHILLDSEPNALFKQGSVARKVETVYRHLVSKLKLSIISNPIKLMGDIAANSVLLADVPLETITKHAKEYTEELDKLSVLRNEMIGLELQEVMEPGKHKQKIKILNKRIKKSKMYPALEHGFIQSLSTNMLLKDFESIRGLQADVDELVGHLVGKKEKRTVIGKLVKKLSTTGFQGEDILSFLARISGKKNKTLSDEFEAMADRLKNMKDSDDLVRYVSEYLGMPSSELVRQSSNIMTNIDGVARWIMYNNLINLGHTEDYAARTALETFIDYRRNLPEVIKLASDLGLMLFPNFWMKYQRVLFNLIKNNPASSTISYTIDQLLGMGSMHPFDASIFSKVADGTVVGVVDPLDEKIYNPWWWMFQ